MGQAVTDLYLDQMRESSHFSKKVGELEKKVKDHQQITENELDTIGEDNFDNSIAMDDLYPFLSDSGFWFCNELL